MTFKERIKKYPEEVALVFTLLTGVVLRFYHLGITSLSNDELSALTRTRFSGFHELIEKGVAVDGHPALVQVFLFYWIKIFGDGVFSIRFPFAIAGITSIFFIYLLGKKWFSKTTGLFAAAAMSTFQFPLLYSQTARPYIIGMMFVLMAAYFWSLLLFENSETADRKKRNQLLIAFIFSMSGCMYTHYFSFLQAGIIGFTGLFLLKSKTWKEYLAAVIIVLLSFLPHLSLFFKQFAYGGVGIWLPKPDETFFKRFIEYCFNDSRLLLYTCAGVCAMSVIFFFKNFKLKKIYLLCVLWFLLPFFIGYYYSVKFNPVLQYSTLLFGFPFLLLFTFSFMKDGLINKKIIFAVLILFTCFSTYSTVIEKQFFRTKHFGVFKELAEDAIHWSDKYGENNILKVISISNPDYINYYFGKMGRGMKIALYKADEESDWAQLLALVDTTSVSYLLYGWSNIYHAPEVDKIIAEKFPIVVERDSFFNAEITLFRRDSLKVLKTLYSFAADFEDNHWGNETDIRTDELSHSGKFSQRVDEKNEYSIALTKKLADIPSFKNARVTVTAWINAKENAANPKLVLSFEGNGNIIDWNCANFKSFNLKPGTWQKVIISKVVPETEAADAVLKIYVWNEKREVFYLDDIVVNIEPTK